MTQEEFRAEMRERDRQRAEDMRAIRASFAEMQNSINDMSKHVRNLVITSAAAVAIMIVVVIISLLRN